MASSSFYIPTAIPMTVPDAAEGVPPPLPPPRYIPDPSQGQEPAWIRWSSHFTFSPEQSLSLYGGLSNQEYHPCGVEPVDDSTSSSPIGRSASHRLGVLHPDIPTMLSYDPTLSLFDAGVGSLVPSKRSAEEPSIDAKSAAPKKRHVSWTPKENETVIELGRQGAGEASKCLPGGSTTSCRSQQVVNLEEKLESLGLNQYLAVMAENGFDDWETVLEITENDLQNMGVKLGHRRILQREIANSRHHNPLEKHGGLRTEEQAETAEVSEVNGPRRRGCPYCSLSFMRHHNLKCHLLLHSQEKTYECPTCQSRFRRLHDLKRHERLHKGEKPHQCRECGRRFARGDQLARHRSNGTCASRRRSLSSGGLSHGNSFVVSSIECPVRVDEIQDGQGPSVRASRHPTEAVEVLQKWLDSHSIKQYPTAEEKQQLATESGLTVAQVSTWFSNARSRHRSPLDEWIASSPEGKTAMEHSIANEWGNLLSYSTSMSQPPSGNSDYGAPDLPPTPHSRAGSVCSAFSQCADAVMSGPPRQGRRKYSIPAPVTPVRTQSHSPALKIGNLSHPTVPKLDRTMTDIYADELYHPLTTTSVSMPPSSPGHSPSTRAISPMHNASTGVSVISTGQSSYQLMTISPETGPLPMPIDIPIDMHATSRMADEKRRGNAGASARWRRRRKEKEQEAFDGVACPRLPMRKSIKDVEKLVKESSPGEAQTRKTNPVKTDKNLYHSNDADNTEPVRVGEGRENTERNDDTVLRRTLDFECLPSSSPSPHSTPDVKTGQGNAGGIQRRCANCGQVGHIKTNKRLCPLLNGTQQPQTGYDTAAFGESSDASVTQGPCFESHDPANFGMNATEVQNSASSQTESVFQCTFCHKQVHPKSWRRHEESMHLPQVQWICQPEGVPTVPTVIAVPPVPSAGSSDSASATIGSHCMFCGMWHPEPSHFEICHRAKECADKPRTQRAFSRKDHLVQHWKNFHGCKPNHKKAEHWKVPINYSGHKWSCGFCGEQLANWEERALHIPKHFREGLTMASWDSKKGQLASVEELFRQFINDM